MRTTAALVAVLFLGLAPLEASADPCPVRHHGAQATATDIDGGVVIELRGDQALLPELEAYARHLADIRDGRMGPPGRGPDATEGARPGPQSGMGPGPARAAGPGPGRYMRQLPPSRIEVERNPDRVSMKIVAEDPGNTARVREIGHAAADTMRTVRCPLPRS